MGGGVARETGYVITKPYPPLSIVKGAHALVIIEKRILYAPNEVSFEVIRTTEALEKAVTKTDPYHTYIERVQLQLDNGFLLVILVQEETGHIKEGVRCSHVQYIQCTAAFKQYVATQRPHVIEKESKRKKTQNEVPRSNAIVSKVVKPVNVKLSLSKSQIDGIMALFNEKKKEFHTIRERERLMKEAKEDYLKGSRITAEQNRDFFNAIVQKIIVAEEDTNGQLVRLLCKNEVPILTAYEKALVKRVGEALAAVILANPELVGDQTEYTLDDIPFQHLEFVRFDLMNILGKEYLPIKGGEGESSRVDKYKETLRELSAWRIKALIEGTDRIYADYSPLPGVAIEPYYEDGEQDILGPGNDLFPYGNRIDSRIIIK